jgi:hypothetical protein
MFRINLPPPYSGSKKKKKPAEARGGLKLITFLVTATDQLTSSPSYHNSTRNIGYFWFRRYSTSRKIAGSVPDEFIELFSIYLILLAQFWSWGQKPSLG